MSNNTSLIKLYCNDNQLPRINVTANTALEEFDVSNNLLSTLNIRNNTAITYLDISNNSDISMVDVKNNTYLQELYCNSIAIGELNISSNTALTKLECHSNQNLTTLTCNDDFDFTTTHISINKGLDIVNTGGSLLIPSVGDLITVNQGIGVVFSVSDDICSIMSVKGDYLTLDLAREWCSNYGIDWELPTSSQLASINASSSTIRSTLSAYGYSIPSGYHWSSTYSSYNNAYVLISLISGSGTSSSWGGDDKYSVRAVISF